MIEKIMGLYCRSIFLVTIVLLFSILKGLAQKRDRNKEVLELFSKHKAVIESKNNAIADNPTPVYGDINGDGKEDCIISYVMISKNGGNAIIGHEAAIYVNTGKAMEMTGTFPSFNFCYTLHYIKKQVIYAKEYECQPPYNAVSRERKFRYTRGEIKHIN